MPRGECRSLWSIPGAREFVDRHTPDLSVQGRAPCPKWGTKERRRYAAKPGVAYTYRYDALKFFKQCVIPLDASLDMKNGDILTWLDGDVITIADVPKGFVEFCLQGNDLCYLGRVRTRSDGDPDKLRGSSSEIGFWAVRLNSATRKFLAALSDAWTTDRFKTFAEWHSAYVFDCVRMEMFSELRMRNLTNGPRGREGGHVWHSQASPPGFIWIILREIEKPFDHSPESAQTMSDPFSDAARHVRNEAERKAAKETAAQKDAIRDKRIADRQVSKIKENKPYEPVLSPIGRKDG